MAEKEITVQKLSDIEDIPAPDDLVVGTGAQSDIIEITEPGDFKRGTLMMSAGGGEFVPVTSSASISSALELCILGEDYEVAEGEIGESWGYFAGRFNGTRLILPYETEGDDHAELVRAIKPGLRKQPIFIEVKGE